MMRLEEIRGRLESSDPEERRRATAELALVDPDKSGELVVRALADEDWRVRKEAVLVGLSHAPNRAMLDHLISALSSPDNVGLRNAAVEAIGGYGDDAVDALATVLPNLDADGRKLGVEALGRSGRVSSLSVLTTLLDDTDPNVRVAAVEAIASIGVAGISEVTGLLEACLFSREPLTALAALEGLNATAAVLAWPTLERCLKEPALRRPALLAAGRSGDARAVPVLIDALETARGSAFAEVTIALRNLSRNAEALAALIESRGRVGSELGRRLVSLARDEQQDGEHRRAALMVLATLALPGAAECALDALADDRLLGEAYEALEVLGDLAVPALVEAARNGSAPLRASCLGLLSRSAEAHHVAAALQAAREALYDEAADVQRAALGLMARLGDARSVEALGRFLRPGISASTLNAAEAALRELSVRHPEAARALARGAEPSGESAHAACVALGALRGGARGSLAEDIAFLSDALSNTSALARRAAVEALAELGGAGGVSAIAFALTDEEREVRRAAVAALGRMRGEDGSVVGLAQLIELVERAPDPDLLAAAVRALGDTGDAHAIAVLKPLFRAAQPYVAVSAVEALARVAGPRRVDVLLEGLAHSDAEVVKATMLALSDAADPRVIAHLGACLDHDAWDVRRLAADLLGRVSNETALGFLRARIPSEDSPPVQEAISRALERSAGVRRTPIPPPLGSLRPR